MWRHGNLCIYYQPFTHFCRKEYTGCICWWKVNGEYVWIISFIKAARICNLLRPQGPNSCAQKDFPCCNVQHKDDKEDADFRIWTATWRSSKWKVKQHAEKNANMLSGRPRTTTVLRSMYGIHICANGRLGVGEIKKLLF